jgi:tRNA (guanine10-N2)-dimethyltransferase
MFWAELSGENAELALGELASALATLSSKATAPKPIKWGLRLCQLETNDPFALASRLAFTHRILKPIGEGKVADIVKALREEGATGLSAAVRKGRWESLPSNLPSVLGKAYVDGGGRVNLTSPERTFVVFSDRDAPRTFAVAEEIARTSRLELEKRPPRTLPFRKPVTLSPLLARALVNLARIRPGGILIDPLCGTGAILIEGGLVGCRLYAADIDGEMVKGTLLNLARFSIVPESIVQADVGELARALKGYSLADGAATDPPYGRASSTHGEAAERVLEKMLDTLPSILSKGARLALMVPSPKISAGVRDPWRLEGVPIPFRVHKSLTRWIFVLSC